MSAAIKVNAGLGSKAWALAGMTGLAGALLGWCLGVSTVAPMHSVPANGEARYAGSPGGGIKDKADASGMTSDVCDRPSVVGRTESAGEAFPATPRLAMTNADAAERNAVLNAILGRTEGAVLSDAELAHQGPGALMAVMNNQQATADVRVEAAVAMQTYFDAPLPTHMARQMLEMAGAQPDPVIQQDALDLLNGRMRSDLVPAVSAYLRSPDAATREMAIQRLNELPHDSQARAALAQAAEQDESEVLRYLASRRP